MAKKPKKCKNPYCIECRWWPAVVKLIGEEGGCYWVDEASGEVMIATGLRCLPNGTLSPMDKDDTPEFWKTECDCGSEWVTRGDLMERGLTKMCPACAASLTNAMRN